MIHRCGLGPECAPQGPRTGSTRFRPPLRLIHDGASLEAADAYRRERYLKISNGKRYLRQKLKAWRDPFSRQKLEWH
jgi:hypothetical protein